MHSVVFKLNENYSKNFKHITAAHFQENGFEEVIGCTVKDQDEKEDLSNYNWLLTLYKEFKGFKVELKKNGYYYLTITKDACKSILTSQFDKARDLIDDYTLDLFRNRRVNSLDISKLVSGNSTGFYFHIFNEREFLNDVEFFEWLYNRCIAFKFDEMVFRLEGTLDYHC